MEIRRKEEKERENKKKKNKRKKKKRFPFLCFVKEILYIRPWKNEIIQMGWFVFENTSSVFCFVCIFFHSNSVLSGRKDRNDYVTETQGAVSPCAEGKRLKGAWGIKSKG